MPKYIVSITGNYLVDLPDLSEATRQYLNDNYEAPSLPEQYGEPEYLGGGISYEPVEVA